MPFPKRLAVSPQGILPLGLGRFGKKGCQLLAGDESAQPLECPDSMGICLRGHPQRGSISKGLCESHETSEAPIDIGTGRRVRRRAAVVGDAVSGFAAVEPKSPFQR
jgi:hypothetical protein